MRWVNELQFTTEAEEARRQFGWSDDKGESFAVGNMLVFKDRVIVLNKDSVAAAADVADGSLDFIQLDDDSDPLYWICDDCEETGNGEPALRGAP